MDLSNELWLQANHHSQNVEFMEPFPSPTHHHHHKEASQVHRNRRIQKKCKLSEMKIHEKLLRGEGSQGVFMV